MSKDARVDVAHELLADHVDAVGFSGEWLETGIWILSTMEGGRKCG
jgi:hypothetical protein